MDVLRRLIAFFKADDSTTQRPPLQRPFPITFAPQTNAQAVRVAPDSPPATTLNLLQIPTDRPVIFIAGGAGEMSEEAIAATQSIIGAVVDFARAHHIAIIDGGTDAGVMGMIGQARKQSGGQFPLVGAAPDALIAYPGFANPNKEGDLDTGHSHFALVDGSAWGAETPLLLGMAHRISSEGKQPVLGLLINGGRIARQEIVDATNERYKMPVIALKGSGRFADELSAALDGAPTEDAEIQTIVKSGLAEVLPIEGGAEAMRHILERYFKRK